MLRNVLGRCALFALCLFLVVCVVTPAGAHDTAPCPGLAQAVGGRVEPSPCVPYGSQFALRVTAATHGQLRSIVLRGPGGLVSGADRALRVDRAGRLVLDTTNYFGARLGSGQYIAWIKDPSGTSPPAQLFFRVSGGDHAPIPTPATSRSHPPTATQSLAPTTIVAPRSATPTAKPTAPSATASATGIAMASVTPTAVASATTIAKASTTPTAAATIPAVAPSATPTAPLPVPHDDLIEIVEVAADLPDDDVVVEYLIVRNSRSAAASMTGWSLGDTAGRRVRLPAFTIEGEAYMWIWTGAGEADETNVYLGLRTAIWDSTGGTALLLDNQGDEVARLTY